MDILTKPIHQRLTADVLVVGSGAAGATAAITAARQGASVLLVERYGFMGGISTQVLDTFYGFYTPGSNPRKVVGGTPDLVLAALQKHDAMILRPNTYGAGQGVTYDPEILKIVWEQLALEAGVRLLYHTFVLETVRDGERVTGVIGVNKAGLVAIEADAVIDASGDADVAAGAGVPFEGARDIPVQSLTTTFKLVNVDTERARQVSRQQLHTLMHDAAASGAYELPRREGSVHITPYAGMMATNMTRVGNIDPTDPEQLTAAEVEGRRQTLEYTRFLRDCVPGYEQAVIGALSTQIGVRESRRIYGEYRLTRQDVLSATKFDDAIAQCGAPIEEHHAGGDTRWEYLPEGETYDIPYRCLVPQVAEGLLVAGRCLSAEHDAHASVRSIGQCMAMGQAAGMAAALAAAQGIMPRAVDIGQLQAGLRQLGAVI